MTVRKKHLAGLAARSQTELCETEDALVDYIRADQKRDGLYESTDADLVKKYDALSKGR